MENQDYASRIYDTFGFDPIKPEDKEEKPIKDKKIDKKD